MQHKKGQDFSRSPRVVNLDHNIRILCPPEAATVGVLSGGVRGAPPTVEVGDHRGFPGRLGFASAGRKMFTVASRTSSNSRGGRASGRSAAKFTLARVSPWT
jgi:hypothetical protein